MAYIQGITTDPLSVVVCVCTYTLMEEDPQGKDDKGSSSPTQTTWHTPCWGPSSPIIFISNVQRTFLQFCHCPFVFFCIYNIVNFRYWNVLPLPQLSASLMVPYVPACVSAWCHSLILQLGRCNKSSRMMSLSIFSSGLMFKPVNTVMCGYWWKLNLQWSKIRRL